MSDVSLISSAFKLLLALPAVVLLAYASLKFSSALSKGALRGRTIQILEKVALNRNQFLYVVKIGETYHLFASSEREITLVRDLDPVEVKSYENSEGLRMDLFGASLQQAVAKMRKSS